VTVDATGKVIKVVVLKGLGHGLDEVAVEALKRAKFKPGTDGTEPIITEIPYSYTFELND
jgi:protein TonB